MRKKQIYWWDYVMDYLMDYYSSIIMNEIIYKWKWIRWKTAIGDKTLD